MNSQTSLHDRLSDLIKLKWCVLLSIPCTSFYQWASCQWEAGCWLITSFIGLDCSLRQGRRLYLTINKALVLQLSLWRTYVYWVNGQLPWSGKPDKQLRENGAMFPLVKSNMNMFVVTVIKIYCTRTWIYWCNCGVGYLIHLLNHNTTFVNSHEGNKFSNWRD